MHAAPCRIILDSINTLFYEVLEDNKKTCREWVEADYLQSRALMTPIPSADSRQTSDSSACSVAGVRDWQTQC